ncbi:MAG: MCE family protein, partial [Actinomycetota bacterium]|nr:MCE family protein [Actinomycetota bacterium]
MRLTRRLLTNLIAVVLLGTLMVGWLVTQLIGSGGLSGPFTVTADFRSSGGVFTNQEVAYRGVLIGKVGKLSLNDNNGVDVQLEISPEWQGKIPADVEAQVQSKSAVGEQFVNLTPLSSSGPMLADGSTIPRDHTNLPVDFQSLLRSLNAVLGDVDPTTARHLIKTLSKGVGGRGGDIATILRSLGTLATTFKNVAPETKSLLSNATQTGAAFLRTKDEFASALHSADQVATAVGDIPQSLRHFFAANNRLAITGSRLLARHREQLADGIRALADFTDYQLTHKNALEDSLRYVPQFLHAVEDSSIPWKSPDGKRFYRIRIGLVIANDRSSWPCKYKLPLHYERYPHVRKDRPTDTSGQCLPSTKESGADAAVALVSALHAWADDHARLADSAHVRYSTGVGQSIAFMWPLDGVITSYFGPRDDGFHPGIDIDGETGDPVVA